MIFIKRLYELQQIDLEIQSSQESLGDIRRQLGESEVLLAVRADILVSKKYLMEIDSQKRDAEWVVEDLRKNIAQVNEKLYGGKIKNPKELLSLEQEVGSFKARLRQKEDNLLDLMTEEETTQARVASETARLEKIEGEWQQEQELLTQRLSEIESQLFDLDQKRNVLTSGIDSQVLKLYEDIKLRKGQAVVKVEQGRCQGCRLNLPTSELQRARAGTLVQCSSCGRILYLG